MKIIELISKQNTKWYSFEFFPPRTENGMSNLINKLNKSNLNPLFVDVTWGAGGGDPLTNSVTGSLVTAKNILYFCKKNIMLHLTCANYTEKESAEIIRIIQDYGIQNILALRGDANSIKRYGKDLVEQIRKIYNNDFGICVAGYPVGHPDSKTIEEDLKYLKEKVDAGADFIITQLFFEAETFITFVKRCRNIGITVPIIPGILPIQSYNSLRHITKLSQMDIPKNILEIMEQNKSNDEAIRNFGIEYAVELIRKCLPHCEGVHFYTLNRLVAIENIVNILDFDMKISKQFPWNDINISKRVDESVRPIFWANKPQSYIIRTEDWNEFPNGRWGNCNKSEYGELNDYYIFHHNRIIESVKDNWIVSLVSIDDVKNIFIKYFNNEILYIPWCLDGIESETLVLKPILKNIVDQGIFPINSQPAINGVSSSDPDFGWGRKDGYIYQKAYLEGFVPKNIVNQLQKGVNKNISYFAINNHNNTVITNIDTEHTIALTWGVFPNIEIVQPTVMNIKSFKIWKKEAFLLWKDGWQKFYDTSSESYSILQEIQNEYYLLVLINNDFMTGHGFDNIASIFI